MSAFFRQFFGSGNFFHYHFLCGECRISRDIKKGLGNIPRPFNICALMTPKKGPLKPVFRQ